MNKRNIFKRSNEKKEFEQKVVDIARVTRVVKGGKRFSFRTVIIIGNKKDKVGVGVAKGSDMKISTQKSFANAKKNLINIKLKGTTIPYPVFNKVGSAKIILKPASKGSGIIAGGAVRIVLGLAGIQDVSAKMLGSQNRLNNARATIDALKQFSVKKTREIILEERKIKKEITKKKTEKNIGIETNKDKKDK